ncbi:MAG: ATP-binding protein [Thermoplasmata archaeon]|nr:ATP-binding protein [Thermoplasmata archaeon]
MEFIGRGYELGKLEDLYRKGRGIAVIWGRRRVGKSELIKHFMDGKEGIYYEIGDERGPAILSEFSAIVADAIGSRASSYPSWRDAILEYADHAPGRKVIAIDEFQYLMMSEPGILKGLQALWDGELSKRDVLLILCGSYLSVMRGVAGSYDSELYGRYGYNDRLLPFTFTEAYGSREDHRRAVEEYAVTGGVPYYMELMDPGKSPVDNLIAMTLDRGAPLANEPLYVFKGELKDSSGYGFYIRSIAMGNRRMGDIASSAGRKGSEVSPILQRLQDIGAVERTVPITADPETSRRGIYEVADVFMLAWYRFVYRARRGTRDDTADAAIGHLRAHFMDTHVAHVFEDVCREVLREALRAEDISASYGRYWNDRDEIDVVAIDGENRVVYAGECRFRDDPVDRDVLEELVAKCAYAKEFDGYTIRYCLFSVSGYTDAALEMAEAEGAILFDNGRVMPRFGI